MTDDDEDYMSESFLKSLEKHDVKPGLCCGAAKRQLDVYKRKQAGHVLPVAEAEELARSKGLDTALDVKNKGFQLLQKSQSKKNTGIFESATNNEDREMNHQWGLIPMGIIPIIMKRGRSGLGEDDFNRLKSPASKKAAIEKLTEQRLDKFRANKVCDSETRHLISDIKLGQKTCYNLDSQAGITEPEPDFLWPYRVVQAIKEKNGEDNDMSESDIDADEPDVLRAKLTHLTSRLRSKYLFCIWCGIRFDSESDLASACPGDSRQLHDDL